MDCLNSNDHTPLSYQEALDWLFSRLPMFSRIGAAAYKPGLQTSEALDSLFGHPHRRFKSVHVAGTNGKGSTSHMLASMLQAQGYRTGLYTSPHLTDFRERMRIDGRMISEREVIRFVRDWQGRAASLELHPSFFELTMMMAFDLFARENVDIAVIEVGMGGRLDSTNIITPLLSVITNISFDHTQFLGSSLKAIAVEKAGIIKSNVPVVIGEASGEVREVFLNKAASESSPIVFAEESDLVSDFRLSDAGWSFRFNKDMDVLVPLAGEYQKKNIRTALAAVEELRNVGVAVSDGAVKQGLRDVDTSTGLRGRWQIMGHDPLVIGDTGHNVAGLSETLGSLATRFPGRHLHFVVGFVNDKDVAHIVDLFPPEATYYFTQASIPRAMDAHDVALNFARKGIKGSVFANVSEAFAAAKSASGPDDVIYIGGSTFIVADFLYLQ